MSKRRKNQFREAALNAKREALASAAKQPKQEPEPERAADGDEEGWLFDTRRDYLEQLAYFKRSQAS